MSKTTKTYPRRQAKGLTAFASATAKEFRAW